jgi:hypothetical protein
MSVKETNLIHYRYSIIVEVDTEVYENPYGNRDELIEAVWEDVTNKLDGTRPKDGLKLKVADLGQ